MAWRTLSQLESPDVGGQRNTGYLWLAYSFFFFIDPVLSHNRRLWIASGITYAVFLALYLTYMYTHRLLLRRLIVAAFYLMGVGTLPYNGGGSCFFIFSAAMLPFTMTSVPRTTMVMIAQAVGIATEGMVLHLNPINTTIAILFSTVVGATNIFIAIQKRADFKLRLAHTEIEQLAAVAERERIARDLHDVLGHTLSLIVLKAELAGRLIDLDPQRAAREIGEVEDTARNALAEVRETIGGYRARGLPSELEHARSTLQAAGVSLSVESSVPQLPVTEETVLCLAVREAVTNIVRHACARHCTVRFTTNVDGRHTLVIADDGPNPVIREGNGLRGMRERIQSLGGDLLLTTGPGVTLSIELPRSAGARQIASSCTSA